MDGGGVVGLVFGEGEGEVLDAVGRAEFSEEHDEFAELFGEPVCVVGCKYSLKSGPGRSLKNGPPRGA